MILKHRLPIGSLTVSKRIAPDGVLTLDKNNQVEVTDEVGKLLLTNPDFTEVITADKKRKSAPEETGLFAEVPAEKPKVEEAPAKTAEDKVEEAPAKTADETTEAPVATSKKKKNTAIKDETK